MVTLEALSLSAHITLVTSVPFCKGGFQRELASDGWWVNGLKPVFDALHQPVHTRTRTKESCFLSFVHWHHNPLSDITASPRFQPLCDALRLVPLPLPETPLPLCHFSGDIWCFVSEKNASVWSLDVGSKQA